MTELDEYFTYKAEKGLKERGLAHLPEYQERLKFELDTILRMGFPGYFLIVQDFINWAKRNDIYVGPGRGSAAGSLASYCLGITNLDPIRWNLLFERFLNPDRISMPDIDVDFEKRYRHLVIDYVRQKYGVDRVAHIGTFGKMLGKSAIKNVAKTLGHPYHVGDELSRLLLPPIAGNPQPLSKSIELEQKLYDYAHGKGVQATILKWAQKVENLVQNAGTHACGIVIANESLLETVPLFLGKEKAVTTQLEMGNIEDMGFVKFDFLALDALDKIHTCVELVKERHGIDINPDNIPLDDEETFHMLRSGDAFGVFQLEASAGIKDLMVQIRPTQVEDLIALVAIYRPGPLGSDYKPRYLAVRAGELSPEYLVPELEPILGRTDGWLIYQEQIMEICKQLCDYTGGQADEMRKAVGKKKQKLMDKHKPMFTEGWVKNGLPEDKALELWDDIVKFAAYGFNRSHAAAYAYITYQTAYLKANYLDLYLCSVMICVGKKAKDKLIRCLTDCKEHGIAILAPDINESKENFTPTKPNEIRFGLGPIKNIGTSASIIIMERDQNGSYKSIRDFYERVDMSVVNRKKLESLIQAGCFDQFGQNRATMLASVELIWVYREEMKKYANKMETYHRKEEMRLQRLRDIEAGTLSAKGSKLKPLKPWKLPEEPEWPSVLELDEMSQADIQQLEYELLGFFVSSHPLDQFKDMEVSGSFNTIEEIKEMPNDTPIEFAGVLTGVNEITTKTMQKMAFAQVEDLTGWLEITIFARSYRTLKDKLQIATPLRIQGTVDATIADEGDRTTKIKVKNITLLDTGNTEKKPERISVTVDANQAGNLSRLLNKYSGNFHEVVITTKLQDGTKLRVPKAQQIGDHKGAFMREVARLTHNETTREQVQ